MGVADFSWQFLDELWDKLGDVPINEQDKIDENFFIWYKGTPKEEIWHWFDERVEGGIGQRYFS